MKKTALVLLTLLLFNQLFAQQEATNWYFGHNAGLKFNLATGTVSALNDGNLNTLEGCASISDSDGNLLFYTDGTTVWNKNHTIMQNGNGLYGDASSSQSAIIVPQPNNPDIYYIFTVDTSTSENEINYGFNYSVVNISSNNNLGKITSKNKNLLPLCSEKITAVLKDCITGSIWVITFASVNGNTQEYNTFYAYEVTNTGINTTPVKSTFPLLITDARGYLKLSPDGTKLANANMTDGLYLYDFDVATGKVSNQLNLHINTSSNFPYGIEFSPNSQFLYTHSSNDYNNFNGYDNPANHFSTLTQFDVSDPNIQSTEITIDQRQLYRGALQLGPDGKIYRALSASYNLGTSHLGVINNPNTKGVACNYTHNAINLSPNLSTQGLPPFIQSFFNQQIDIIKNGTSTTNLNLCEGESHTLISKNITGADYYWYKDGNPLSESDFDLVVDKTGYYEVYIDQNNGDCPIEGKAYVTVNPLPTALNANLVQCDDNDANIGQTTFNLTEANNDLTGGATDVTTHFYDSASDAQYDTNEIDGNSYQNQTNPQTIYVRVVDDNTGCFSFSELTLNVSVTSANNAVLKKCDDDGIEDGKYEFNLQDSENDVNNGLPNNLNFSYYETHEDALLEINPLNNNYTNTTAYNQTIYVRVENQNACYGINEIELRVLELPDIITEDEVNYCLNSYPDTIPINAGVINGNQNDYDYSWNTGETTYQIEINQPGNYQVTITNANNCSKIRTVTVLPSNIATIEDVEVVDASENNTLTILVSGEGDYEYALDNINGPYYDSNYFENVTSGFHTVFVRDKNNCGIANKTVSVIGFPKFFTPNNDGYNDTWQIQGINNQFQPNTIIYIFDRYGKLLAQINPLGAGWNGTYRDKLMPADDYWFMVELQDGRAFRGHFSLKL